ncbi:efflux RND transporter periplasmic adaptor subunit [Marinihelvus fidelis]|uniref:efflux RND transporter periplasmic adaptor subunit n=1 Tax=Marinihelvus fidelis TaxID=2613842 RepID=UPI001784477D|nr:efflux RND transporter periplasmic adaptor subunit [Marinihelvus fidelis]
MLPLLLAGAVTLLSGCTPEGQAQATPYHHKAELLTVQMQAGYAVTREYAGEVQATQATRLGFERAGQVSSLAVDEGARVEAGQVLATLDTRLLDAERDELQARAEELRAELDLAERNESRVARLRTDQLASERELDEAASRSALLRASLKRVQADLESNRVRLAQSSLKAPFAARVASRDVDSGTVVDAGTAIFTLVQDDGLEIRAGLPADLAESLQPGQAIRARVGQAAADVTVLAVGPRVDAVTRTRPVRFTSPGNGYPGEIAYIVIDEPVDAEGAWLPDTAITEGARGTWIIYAAVDDGTDPSLLTLEARSVSIRHAAAGQVYVTGAIEDDARVVAAGLHRLAPGQKVLAATPEELADARQDP